MISRKRKIILICSALLLLGILFLGLAHKKGEAPSLTIEGLSRIPGKNDLTTVAATDNNYYFSNGRAFIKYSRANNQSMVITDTNQLPKILSIAVSPKEDYVAFLTNADAINVEPFKSISPGKDDQNTRKWWLLNTASHQIIYIASDASSLSWLDDSSYVFSSGSNILKGVAATPKNTVRLYQGKETVKISGVINNEIYFNERNTQFAKLNNSNQVEKLYDPGTSVLLSRKDGCFFHQSAFDQMDTTINKLVGCLGHDFDLPGSIISSIFSQDNHYFFYYSLSEKDGELQGNYVDLLTGKTGIWNNGADIKSTDIELIYVKNKDDVVLRAANNYYGHTQGANLLTSNDSFTVGNAVVDLDKQNQTVIASQSSAYSDTEKSQIVNSVAQKGFDTNLLEFRFNVLTGDDNRWD